ncbi:hypothetical protein QTO01_19115 [Vibrio mytili]|uniref:Uncharacterized protein n=1 Tax=Vibrio mytili TaxID=50718 RepID=A0A0C3E9W4_9VIBR|nr:hypothetical protein [Vibrio mytili]KIN11183.1 hypothetical protein SU60_08985 [Vibrio mytili]
MPAQKLTKARLAQILITLSILTIAFFWRTLTHEDIERLDCSEKRSCVVNIGEEKITITRNSQGISFETTKSNTIKIDLNQDNAFSSISVSDEIIDWNSISENKVIRLKIDGNIVLIHL